MNAYSSSQVEDARSLVVRWGVLEIAVPVCAIVEDPIFVQCPQFHRCER
jgi:hypothetical protein